MLRACTLDFKGNWRKYLPLAEFAYNNSYQATIGMAPYEALYGRRCHSPIHWHEVVRRKIDRIEHIEKTDFVQETTEFKVSPMKGIMRFGKKGRLSPRYVGPYMIVERMGKVAYKLELPQEMTTIHNVFHVSMLKKYVLDPSHVLTPQLVQIEESFSYEEKPTTILDRGVKKLRNKEIPLVKVLWSNHKVEEATWEREEDIRAKYPHLL
ncbi:hypothetical protein DH2020_043250 [Rehmannia glutinosa]|uniref:Tf2-1-like SH3-like domain-containing protein n=1 Tax=Rehmannia glutinosa TaxID=99300 RepID=A0ABR0UL26_REHGL